MMTDLTLAHDNELERQGTPAARAVLDARTRAARHVTLTLARMCGSPDRPWHLVPHVTGDDTIGLVDVARGVAWASAVPAGPDVAAFGPLDGIYAAAGMPPGADGTVHIDGEPVQHAGSAAVGGEVVPPTAPDGWAQIAVPTWRGWDDSQGRMVPVPSREFPPDSWTRPEPVATGLMTCYGRPGDDSGDWVQALGPFPHGAPDWVVGGRSVTVLHEISRATRESMQRMERPELALAWLGWERGDDATETGRLRPVIAAWRANLPAMLRRAAARAENEPPTRGGNARDTETGERIATALRSAADGLADADPDRLRTMARACRHGDGNWQAVTGVWSCVSALEALAHATDILDEGAPGAPFDAARRLARGYAGELLSDIWPLAGDEPVGLAEIADRLHVARRTVDSWQNRGLLPEPRWTVGGRPAWDWDTIRTWAVETGRLTSG